MIFKIYLYYRYSYVYYLNEYKHTMDIRLVHTSLELLGMRMQRVALSYEKIEQNRIISVLYGLPEHFCRYFMLYN